MTTPIMNRKRELIVIMYKNTYMSHICSQVNKFFAGLENRDYGRRGSAALTMRHPAIRKSWHLLRKEVAVARLV
jgi:hypothetical protein